MRDFGCDGKGSIETGTQQPLNEAESKVKRWGISNILRWVWITEKSPAAGREYKRINERNASNVPTIPVTPANQAGAATPQVIRDMKTLLTVTARLHKE